MCEPGQSEGGCRCHTGRRRSLIQPRLLLQLARKPAHGYELMEALDEGVDGQAPDPGALYRTLRALEEDGLVRSTWNTAGAGPARRVYELTDQGVEFLHAWAASIRGARTQLDRFLASYEEQFSTQTGG